jgi:dCTP deaminase
MEDAMSSYGILSDLAIKHAVDEGAIRIDPFDPKHVNPASYDLTLGDEVTVYKKWVSYDENYEDRGPMGTTPCTADAHGSRNGRDLFPRDGYLDVREEPEAVTFKVNPERGWILKPGIGYLMHTRERIWTEKYVPIVDGKSSIGRLFVQIHATAGYGDPGFDGQYTLEVIVQHAIKVYPGMRIGQIRFHTMNGIVGTPYNQVGHYQDIAARGAVPSQAWKQFQKMRCGVILKVSPDTGKEEVCGKESRRALSKKEGCCDDCFARMEASGDFTEAELERDYPLA